MNELYARTALVIGEDGVERLKNSRVTVAGLGGVGGHCAEALARAGVGRLHLIDCDVVTESNLNRQLVAAKSTLGRGKTQVMAERIRDVSDCETTIGTARILPENASACIPGDMDFLVDAIDQVSAKIALAALAYERGVGIVSCMGAGNRLDPTQFYVTDLFATEGDPLARKMRQELRKRGVPALPVVCSHEAPHVRPGQTTIGSFAPATAAAGLALAGYALRRLLGYEG